MMMTLNYKLSNQLKNQRTDKSRLWVHPGSVLDNKHITGKTKKAHETEPVLCVVGQ
jgi:hypothetical protein